MIKNVTTPIPCTEIYETNAASENLTDLYETEAARIWSHLPFFQGSVGQHGHCDSWGSDASPIQNAASGELLQIKTLIENLNIYMETCLKSHSTMFGQYYERDSPIHLLKFSGTSFSTPLTVPDNFYATTVFTALTDAEIYFPKFSKQVFLEPGDIVVAPSLFPYEKTMRPRKTDPAYILIKHLVG
jgi:hypothetical protein